LVCEAVREKRVAIVENAADEHRVSEHFQRIVEATHFAVVPLIAKDEAVGAIIVDNRYSQREIQADEMELLTIYANHVGLAIENAEAYDALHVNFGKLQEAYRELREAQGKLVQAEKLAAVGEVAAHVAHEIRNPLVTIGGFARNVHRQLGEDDPRGQKMAIVVEEVERLERILATVMDFSKPSAPWKRPTKINQVIQNSCVLVAGDMEKAGAELDARLDPRLPLVMVDAEQLKQALLNILKNAAQSLGDGGRVTVSSRFEDSAIWIDIADTGKGIPDDMLPNLFDPFFTTRPDGTGLGLAVTRKIIVDHGGDIDCKSKLGVGTTFTISLPADAPAASRRRAAALQRSQARAAGHSGPVETERADEPTGEPKGESE
jgi:hypothetical protein